MWGFAMAVRERVKNTRNNKVQEADHRGLQTVRKSTSDTAYATK